MLLCVTSATPKDVVETAVRLCFKETEVHVLHIVHLLNDFVRKEVSKEFAWITEIFKKSGIKCDLDIVESTDVKNAIISFAKKNSSDVIVTGVIPRKGLLGFFSESVSDYVVKNAPCTVILVRKTGQLA